MSTDVVDQDQGPSPSMEELTFTAEPGGPLTAERGGELHTEAVGKLTVAGKMSAADKLLSPTEMEEFEKCERTIARGKKAFIDVGNALATIRDKRLYRQTHDTFRAYCQERWGFSDSRARQLITGVKVQETVTRVTLPDEATARVLNRVPDEQREACYESYIGLAKDRGEEPSAAGLKDYVDTWLADDEPYSEPAEEADGQVAQDVDDRPPRPHVANNSGENEWYTPREYVEAVRAVLGEIDVDPASSDVANELVKARRYYTAERDGLQQEWPGRVFLNPPYAQPLVARFADALVAKFRAGEVTEAIALVNNATETAWFHTIMSAASAISFPRGRVKFLDPNGTPNGAPLQGQAVLYFGPNVTRFHQALDPFGFVLIPSPFAAGQEAVA